MILTNFVNSRFFLIRQSLLVVLLLSFSGQASAVTVINVGVIETGYKKQTYKIVIDAFEAKNPDIKIRLRVLDGNNFTKINNSLIDHLAEDPFHIDLLAWYGGLRTERLIKKQLLEPLDMFWQQNQLDDAFSEANKENVSYQGHVYGLPLSYYSWGIFYNKNVFSRLNIAVPITWQEFLDALAVLKANDLTPIAIGTKEPWPAAGWFDYLILRNNSFAFYKQLMGGKISYDSPQVRKALKTWQELINKKYFSRSPNRLDGENLLPLISREIAGVKLTGSFSLNKVADRFKKDFGFFTFPKMEGETLEVNEIAPLSTVSLLRSSKHKEQALRFLQYLSLSSTQVDFNKRKDMLSPHFLAENNHSGIINKGSVQLDKADHFSQYYDRETNEEMAKFATQAFADFIEHGDIERLVDQLEGQRKKVFNLM